MWTEDSAYYAHISVINKAKGVFGLLARAAKQSETRAVYGGGQVHLTLCYSSLKSGDKKNIRKKH